MNTAPRIYQMPSDQDVGRVPDEILVSKLPAPALRLWFAIRKRQGDNASAWYPFVEYARMADVKEKEVYRLVDLLAEYGWLERLGGKHLACKIGRPYEAGKRGGKRETTPKEGGISTTPKEGGTTTPKEGVRLPPKKGVTPIQKESRKNPDTACAGFDDFWKAFAKSADKPKCVRKWRNMTRAQRAAALANVEAYVAATPEKRYRKNPLTWLNGECWNDDLPVHEPAPLLKRDHGYTSAECVRLSHSLGLTGSDWRPFGKDNLGNDLWRLSPDACAKLTLA